MSHRPFPKDTLLAPICANSKGKFLGEVDTREAIELIVHETEKLAGEAVGAVESMGRGDSRQVQD